MILPDTTLAQKVAMPKSKSADFGTQTVQHLTTPPQSVALPSTSSAGDVYETETSPVSNRFAGATAAAYVDDDVKGAKERYAHLLGSLSVRLLAHTCHHVHKRGVLDAEYGLRKIGNRFL